MRLRLTAVLLLVSAARGDRWNHKSSCFQAVRWKGDAPIVRLEGRWYRLTSLQGQKPGKILDFCRNEYGRKWRWRFVEDLGQVLDEMNIPPAKTVKLVLEPLPKGKRRTIEAPMTFALRQQAKQAGNDQPFVNVARQHGAGSPKFAQLAKRIRPDHYAKGDKLLAAEAASDLDELEGLLEGCYAYLAARKLDYRAALDTIRAGLEDRIEKATFALQLRKFLALFGDGHSTVEMSLGRMGGRVYLPYLFGEERGRIFVFKPDRSGFVDEDHPFVESMDDLPIGKWIEASRSVVAQGSPQFARRQMRRNLRYVGYLRQQLGLRHRQSLRMTLVSADQSSRKKLRVELVGQRGMYGAWPRTLSRILDGRIGYLRIERMRSNRKWLAGLEERMNSFRETRGLIIDVRGNGGGSRAALRTLAPYFMTEKDPPRIANVAAYRLPPWEGKPTPQGHLDNRWLYPLTWSGWNQAARGAIRNHLKAFRPQWKLPGKGFTDWHFMLLDRSGASAPYVYREPVVILMDAGCFSATDIFLGAFKGWPGITLLGTPSGGGSGRARELHLAASGLTIRLSSMASFQPGGKRYDGNGVKPDVVVERARGDWIGRGDRQLDEAKKQLN